MPDTKRHLREEDRGVIYRMNKAGKTQSEIAASIGFGQSAVSKELARNRGEKGYRFKQAQEKAAKRKRQKKPRKRVIGVELQMKIDEQLNRKHSPEQISGSLKEEGLNVSHETIYNYIREERKEGGMLYKSLRINGKRRYRRRAKAGRIGKIPERIGIEERPKIVERRIRYGDWEADLIEGSKGSGYLLSLYERKSRFGKLVYLPTKEAKGVTEAIIETLSDYRVKTVTYDNGLEFSQHQKVSNELNAKGYFCAPYHSWEKGGVENYNGLVRQYFPKGSSFANLIEKEIKRVEKEINERPRKTHNFRSPSSYERKLAA